MNALIRIAAAAMAVTLAGCSNFQYVNPHLSTQQQSLETLDQASQLGARAD